MAWKRLKAIIGNTRPKMHADGSSTRERLEAVRRHFQRMGGDYGGDPDIEFAPAPPLPQPIPDGPFSASELQVVCSSFPRGKAPGSDGIPAECILALLDDEEVLTAILSVINRVWETGEVEPEWYEIVQVPIPKKGDLRQLQNWRPICLVNVIVKIMNKMIYNRIVPAVDGVLRDAQFGFRQNRSTTTAHIIVNEVLSKARRDKSSLFLGFVDFSKAFPSISFASIHAALCAFHVPPRLCSMIMAVYQHLKAFVRTPLGDTEPFDIDTGTLQGDVLAPFLFIMVLDRVLHAALDCHDDGLLLRKQGTRSRPQRGELLTDVDYADDVVLFAQTSVQLVRMLSRIVAEAARVNLRLNIGPAKTAFMSLDPAAPSQLQVADLPPIPRVQEYTYLGQVLRVSAPSASLDSRLQLAWAATHRLSPFWSLPLSIATKLRIFDVMVYPVLLYGLASTPLTASQCQRADRQLTRMRCVATRVRRWSDGLPLNVASLYGDTLRFPERRMDAPPLSTVAFLPP